jgi:hypothetical protein
MPWGWEGLMRRATLFFIILFFLLAACTGSAPDATATVTPTAISDIALQPSDTPSPSDTPAPTVTPSPIPPTVTDTVTPEPTATPISEPQWFVRVKEASDEDIAYVYNSPTDTPPAFLQDVVEYSFKLSPNKTYVVKCEKKDEDGCHGLTLYRTADGQIISQVQDVIIEDARSISWAKDETVLSFATQQPVDDDDKFTDDIYVWKTDGSQPYIIGHGNIGDSGSWFSDAKRLMVKFCDPDSLDPGVPCPYQILYLDGRPPKIIYVPLGWAYDENGYSLLPNDVITKISSCCVSCSFGNYYDANTGERISELDWKHCRIPFLISVQRPIISSDNRWIIVDRTDPEYLFNEIPALTYILYDFQRSQPYTISTSVNLYIDFIGLTPDSTQFLLIRRPITDTVTEQPDAPFGLLSLDPLTRQLTLVDPAIHDAWLSPDGNYLFGVSETNSIHYGAIYTLDGNPVTPLQAVTDQAHPWDLQEFGEHGNLRFTWSNDSSQMAYRDEWGAAWLAGVDGQIRPLAAGLPDETTESATFYSELFIWSPDNTRLLVRSDKWAWVVYLP